MAVVIRFALGGSVELEHGGDADFPGSLRDGRPLGANNDFALIFVAAQFALDGHVRTFGQGGGEVGQFTGRLAESAPAPSVRLPADLLVFFQPRIGRTE
jgi:hypothetical protein